MWKIKCKIEPCKSIWEKKQNCNFVYIKNSSPMRLDMFIWLYALFVLNVVCWIANTKDLCVVERSV